MINSKTMKKMLIVITFSLLATCHVTAENVINHYFDDFAVKDLLLENYKVTPARDWSVKDGRLHAKPTATASVTLKKEIPNDKDMMVEVDISLSQLINHFAGVRFKGVNFMIRPDGFWYTYQVKGKDGYLGNLIQQEIKKDKQYKFKIISRRSEKALLFTWFVDGLKIGEFMETEKIKGGDVFLALFVNKTPCSYDNLSISELSKERVSSNLLKNSSFEILQDGWPLNFRVGNTSASFLINYGSIENVWKSRVLDTDIHHTGNNSLKLIVSDDIKHNTLTSSAITVSVGKPFVYSLYLKSSEDKMPVELFAWEWTGKRHSKTVHVGTDWQRYQLVVPSAAKRNIRVGVKASEKGILWADSLQVEADEKATPYEASSLDKRTALGKLSKTVYPKKIIVKKFNSPPVMDGKLEKQWLEMNKTDRFLISGKKPSDKTIAYVGSDDENLYIGLKCYSRDLNKLVANAKKHDDPKIWSDDNIELFIDQNFDRETYFHFTVNSQGMKADVGPGRNMGWSAEWEAKTSLNPKERCWECEIKLPLSILKINDFQVDEWGINFCRSVKDVGEYSCTSLIDAVDFHSVKNYGSILWGKNTLKSFYYPVTGLRIAEDPSSKKLKVEGAIQNLTEKTSDIQLEFRVDSNIVAQKNLGKIAKNEKKAFSLPYKGKLSKKNVKLIGSLSDSNNKVLAVFDSHPEVVKGAKIYMRRNYYMNEKDAVLVADINFSIPNGMTARVMIHPSQGKGSPLWSGNFNKVTKNMRLPLPIEKLKSGDYRVTLVLISADKVVFQTTTALRKMDLRQNGVQIDRERLCIVVDGKPFFVIAPLTQTMTGHDLAFAEKYVDHYYKAGFKTIMAVMGCHHKNFSQFNQDLLELAAARGMKVLFWPAGFQDPRFHKYGIDRMVKEFGGSPSLIAWLAVDEPELHATEKQVWDTIRSFRKFDPYHPVFMNNSVMGIPARYADLDTDILSIDDYLTNRQGRTVKSVLDQVKIMVGVGRLEQKPSFMFLVGNNTSLHSREPSAAEQVAQTYGTLIAGVTGIYYFTGQPMVQKHWEAYIRTNREILSLSDIIFSLENVTATKILDPSINHMTRKHKGYLYVISVNIEDQPVETRISMLTGINLSSHVEVLFENREIELKDNSFKDSYKPHQRHVYRVKIK